MAAATAPAEPAIGLDEEEAALRLARGEGGAAPARGSRTVGEILGANVFTRFNALLGALLAVILVIGPIQDAAFGVVLLSNTLIGVVQEVRAKRTLDRLSVVTAPRARVVRSGRVRDVAAGEVVLGDLLDLRAGDQVVADGDVVESDGLEVDESMLTGESDAVHKRPGDGVLSGTVVVGGGGRCVATGVGAAAYGRRLAAEARRFALVRSELRSGINRVLQVITWLMVPLAILLVLGQVRADGRSVDAVRGTVSGLVAMVPEGLVLLTSLAFAVAVIRLGRRRVLAQELAAVEMLARVDVVCLDKTGTLTEGTMTVERVDPLVADGAHEGALAALAAAEPRPNASLRAIAAAFPRQPVEAVAAVPFSSARRWSAVTLPGGATWVLGAPETLLAAVEGSGGLAERVRADAEAGRRVLLLARADEHLAGERMPDRLTPWALVVLGERVRPDARDTIRFFGEQGVALKVISGDSPATVAAVAGAAGVPRASAAVDASTLPEKGPELVAMLEDNAVFGRVTPHMKRAMVAGLQSAGHVVAMTGDGVNDVLALKQADIGVAMGSGSDASRGVAQLVLADSSFASLPHAVAEGRRVIANVERVAALFLTKTVYAMLLALAVSAATLPFPLLPRQLTLVASVTVGMPAFFLALAPGAPRARRGFTRRALRIAVPAGALATLASFTAYALVLKQGDTSLDESRTVATLALTGVGLWLLTVVARPLTPAKTMLIAAMAAAFAIAIAVPPFPQVFGLNHPGPLLWFAVVGVVASTVALAELAWRTLDWTRRAVAARAGARTRP